MSAMDQYAAEHANETGANDNLVAELHAEDGQHEGGTEPGSDQDAARRKRKMITMGICGAMAVLVLGAVGTKVLKSKAPESQMQMQMAGAPESVVAAQAPNTPMVAPVVGDAPAEGPGAISQGVGAPVQMGAPTPGGVSAPQLAPAAPMAPIAPAAPGALANVQTSPTMPAAPIAVTQAPGAPVQSAPELSKPVAGAPAATEVNSQANKVAKGSQPSYFDAQAQDKLRLQVDALQKTLKAKEDENANLRMTLQATKAELMSAQSTVAQPKVSQPVAKAAQPIITERKADVAKADTAKRASAPLAKKAEEAKEAPKQASADKGAEKSGSKVRSDFTVYAVTDGRAWVVAKDGERHGPLVVGSPLADGSKVTSLDPTRGVLGTTTGEIH